MSDERAPQCTGAEESEQVDEMRATAYHEAGHAVVGHLTGGRIMRVSIVPGADGHGHCDKEGPIGTGEVICTCLAGPVAQSRVLKSDQECNAEELQEVMMEIRRS